VNETALELASPYDPVPTLFATTLQTVPWVAFRFEPEIMHPLPITTKLTDPEPMPPFVVSTIAVPAVPVVLVFAITKVG